MEFSLTVASHLAVNCGPLESVEGGLMIDLSGLDCVLAARRRLMLAITALVTVALALVAPTAASAFTGTGTLTGTSKFAVPGCGTDRGAFATTVTLAADGTWSAQSSEGPSFSGTYVAIGGANRKVRLTFDADTTAALTSGIVVDASRLCHATVTVTGSHPRTLTLSLIHKGTQAKLVIVDVISGKARGRSGTGSYHVTGRGPWTAG